MWVGEVAGVGTMPSEGSQGEVLGDSSPHILLRGGGSVRKDTSYFFVILDSNTGSHTCQASMQAAPSNGSSMGLFYEEDYWGGLLGKWKH